MGLAAGCHSHAPPIDPHCAEVRIWPPPTALGGSAKQLLIGILCLCCELSLFLHELVSVMPVCPVCAWGWQIENAPP